MPRPHPGPTRLLPVLALLAAIGASGPAAQAQGDDPRTIGGEAQSLYMAAQQTADAHERGRLLFLVSRRLEAIRRRFPGSAVAAQIALGRYRGIDVAEVERAARGWQAANPDAAAALRGRSLVPNFNAGDPSGGDPPRSALLPNFSNHGAVSPSPSARLARRALVERLRQAVVIVYVQGATTEVTGSGFFISPNHILTNAHVVDGFDKVVIANKTLGIKAGNVRYRSNATGNTGIDAAVIEILNYKSDVVLPFAKDLAEGEEVTIAGYPGRALDVDLGASRFFSLLREARLPPADSIPSVRFDFGAVQAVFVNDQSGVENVQSGVNASSGNSGSPIVNECGQVVSQHYAGSVAKLDIRGGTAFGNTAKFNYGISFRELTKFLAAAGVPFTAATDRCS
jgi:hypothetical protein